MLPVPYDRMIPGPAPWQMQINVPVIEAEQVLLPFMPGLFQEMVNKLYQNAQKSALYTFAYNLVSSNAYNNKDAMILLDIAATYITSYLYSGHQLTPQLVNDSAPLGLDLYVASLLRKFQNLNQILTPEELQVIGQNLQVLDGLQGQKAQRPPVAQYQQQQQQFGYGQPQQAGFNGYSQEAPDLASSQQGYANQQHTVPATLDNSFGAGFGSEPGVVSSPSTDSFGDDFGFGSKQKTVPAKEPTVRTTDRSLSSNVNQNLFLKHSSTRPLATKGVSIKLASKAGKYFWSISMDRDSHTLLSLVENLKNPIDTDHDKLTGGHLKMSCLIDKKVITTSAKDIENYVLDDIYSVENTTDYCVIDGVRLNDIPVPMEGKAPIDLLHSTFTDEEGATRKVVSLYTFAEMLRSRVMEPEFKLAKKRINDHYTKLVNERLQYSYESGTTIDDFVEDYGDELVGAVSAEFTEDNIKSWLALDKLFGKEFKGKITKTGENAVVDYIDSEDTRVHRSFVSPEHTVYIVCDLYKVGILEEDIEAILNGEIRALDFRNTPFLIEAADEVFKDTSRDAALKRIALVHNDELVTIGITWDYLDESWVLYGV